MENLKGIKETKEMLDLLLSVLDVGMKARADGKVDMADLGLVLQIVPNLGPAFEGIGEIKAEVSDLSSDEAAELIAHVMGKLILDDAKARLVVEKGLRALVANYELYKAIKA